MKFKIRQIHIIIIILGVLFLFIPVFHTNLWFDESYTVGIVNKSFLDIWNIGKNDVHPVLYYWILHILNLIFGSNILVYRIFSVLCISLISILGYTHIRKDFGEKSGFLFSLFMFILPVNVVYAGEIRMYSLAMLFVTLMSIYAYRIFRNLFVEKTQIGVNKNIKNWVFFTLFSVASCYTHYYALMMAFLENLLLFIVIVIQAVKQKKITFNLKIFLFSALVQVGIYLPWLISLLQKVSKPGAFWIKIIFPDSYLEFFMFPFTGNLGGENYVPMQIAILFGLSICVYMVYVHIFNKKAEKLKFAKISIMCWVLLAIIAYITSLVIGRTIIYARYMLVAEGLFVFFIASTMAEKGKKYINIALILTSVVLSIFVVYKLCEGNYDKNNIEFKNYLIKSVQKEDILICSNELTGLVISTYLPDNAIYFWDKAEWNVEEAYKAFGKTVYNLDFLENYSGRVWITNDMIYEDLLKKYDIELLDKKQFNIKYKNQQYNLILLKK